MQQTSAELREIADAIDTRGGFAGAADCGRIGRSAAAKRLDQEAVTLAMAAHVRHTEMRYDELLTHGIDRWEARDRVRQDTDHTLRRWRGAS